MATFETTNQLTLLELARRKAPDGNLATIAEVLSKTNEILLDAVWQEANGSSFHKIVQRMTLPKASYRKLNAGVGVSASQTREITENIALLEVYSEVDKKLAEMAPDSEAFRNSEAVAFLEGLNQQLAQGIIYNDAAADPETFTGLAPRLDDLSLDNVLGAGGSGDDLTSVYVVDWGLRNVSIIYPKGSAEMGVTHTDLGEVTLKDGDGRQYQGFRDHFRVEAGLAVYDERCIARVCNIETQGTSNILDEDLVMQALNNMPQRGANAVIYCNRTILNQLDILAKDKTNVQYGPNDAFGRSTMIFRGCPVRLVDAITDAESEVI